MMGYDMSFRIVGMTGHYAEKYSALLKDAQNFGLLFREIDASFDITRLEEGLVWDPYLVFQFLSKVLKEVVVKSAQRDFIIGLCRRGDDVLLSGVKGSDGEREIEVYHTGRVLISRDCCSGEEGVIEGPVEFESGVYDVVRVEQGKFFKEDLMNLMNLCEEAMAKGMDIYGVKVEAGGLEVAKLFQLD